MVVRLLYTDFQAIVNSYLSTTETTTHSAPYPKSILRSIFEVNCEPQAFPPQLIHEWLKTSLDLSTNDSANTRTSKKPMSSIGRTLVLNTDFLHNYISSGGEFEVALAGEDRPNPVSLMHSSMNRLKQIAYLKSSRWNGMNIASLSCRGSMRLIASGFA